MKTKKILLILSFVITINLHSQSLNYDTNFGNNGFALIDNNLNNTYNLRDFNVQNDGKIIVLGIQIINNNIQSIISRFLNNGILDTTYGINGHFIINESCNVFHLLQTGKIVLISSNQNFENKIYRINQNGTLDSNFGINGNISNINYMENTGGKIDQNDNLFFINGNPSLNSRILKKLNLTTGIFDTTFGINGELILPTNDSQTVLKIDNNSLFISKIFNKQFSPFGRIFTIFKINQLGIIDSTYGINGSIQTAETFDFDNSQVSSTPILNFENELLIGRNERVGGFLFSRINKINANGTYNTIFNANNNTYNTNHEMRSIISQNNRIYVLAVNKINNFSNLSLFKYNEFGVLDVSFNSTGSFVDTLNSNQESPSYKFTVLNDESIIVAVNIDDGISNIPYLVKYKSQNLDTTTHDFKNIIFNNPVKEILKIESDNLIKTIEMYTLDGKKISQSNQNSINISNFSTGIYLAKIEFQNGKITVQKVIKN